MNRHPSHVSSMLQLSEVCRLGEDLALSAELLERSLFTLEAAAHPLFSVTSGAARLDYRRRENRWDATRAGLARSVTHQLISALPGQTCSIPLGVFTFNENCGDLRRE